MVDVETRNTLKFLKQKSLNTRFVFLSPVGLKMTLNSICFLIWNIFPTLKSYFGCQSYSSLKIISIPTHDRLKSFSEQEKVYLELFRPKCFLFVQKKMQNKFVRETKQFVASRLSTLQIMCNLKVSSKILIKLLMWGFCFKILPYICCFRFLNVQTVDVN